MTYFAILISSFIVPGAYAILIRNYIPNFKQFCISTTIVAVLYLIWDAVFTADGIWWFNAKYCSEIAIVGMPLEEILFFFVIPFCSLFLHFALKTYFSVARKKAFNVIFSYVTYIIIAGAFLLAILFHKQSYTSVNFFILGTVALLAYLLEKSELIQFYLSFLIIILLFIIVNGALTGMFSSISDAIVQYNPDHMIGIRCVTIPIEDFGYAYSMLVLNLIVYKRLQVNYTST